MNKKITVNLAVAIAIIAMTVTFVITMLVAMRMFDSTVSSVRARETMHNKLAEVDKSVRANYSGEINDTTLNDALCTGYLAGLGDRNAMYYTAKQYIELQGVLSGRIIGIGADVIKDVNGYARIIRVYSDSPASEAGLEKNWFITRIGDVSVASLSQSQINSLLQGESGTSVTITVLNLLGEEFTVELQRRAFDAPSIEYELLEDSGVGYIKISTFTSGTEQEVKEAIEAMQAAESPVEGLVFDVRNNTSTALEYAMKVIDLLCPAGSIASQVDKDGNIKLLDTSDNKEVELPMVVLVNGNTASAAELFAVSLRNFDKGRIVGVRTAGKGTVQCSPVALSDGSAIVYTVGTLLDKNGESFDGVGIAPDVEIALKTDEETNFYTLTIETDPQIQKALETARALIGKQVLGIGTTTSEETTEDVSDASASAATTSPAGEEPGVEAGEPAA